MDDRRLDLDLEWWEPWTPAEVAERLRGADVRWYVLGGWALDLFLGRRTREHEDIEVGVPRDQFPAIQAALDDLELVVVGDGHAWPLTDESLRAHRQTWAREPGGPWRLDIIREHWDGDDWLYRRDDRIRRPAASTLAETSDAIPFLQPDIVLLFKAKAPRAKDDADLAAVLPHLDAERRRWLVDALLLVHPGHPWIELVADFPAPAGHRDRGSERR